MGAQKIAFFTDDDEDFLAIIPHSIQHPNFKVRTYCTNNGYQAIDEIIKVKPDILFIDFGLPRANGGQILPILKSIQAFAHIPVYFVTGYSKEEVLPFLEGVDYDGILSKNESLKLGISRILDQLDRAVTAE